MNATEHIRQYKEAKFGHPDVPISFSEDCVAKLMEAYYERKINEEPEPDLSCYTAETLLNAICKVYNVTPDQLRAGNRKKEIVRVRAIYFYLSRELKFSTTDAGLYVGRDHATVIHHNKKIRGFLEEGKPWFRPELKREIQEVKKLISCK